MAWLCQKKEKKGLHILWQCYEPIRSAQQLEIKKNVKIKGRKITNNRPFLLPYQSIFLSS